MKKHYFLLLAAGCLSCLSVNAQGKLHGPVLKRDARHPKIQRTVDLPANQVLTRAAAADQSLPDSMVWVKPEDGGKYWKEVYTYTEGGLLEKIEGLEWNYDLSDWVHYEEYNYVYNDDGSRDSYTYTSEDGYEQEFKFAYGEKTGSYIGKITFPDGLTMDYKADWTYNDRGHVLTQTDYSSLDINDDGKIDDKDYNADGTPWYKRVTYASEYDDSDNCTKETEVEFYADGEIYSEKVTTTEWNGLSYTDKAVTDYPYEERTETSEHKLDVKEGNPQESLFYEKDNDTGEWVLKDKYYTYFPKGGETADESIEAPTEGVKVSAADGKIFISAAENVRVEVFSILGKCCYQEVVSGDASVSGLPSGIYVVRAAGKATKVCVR